MDAAGSNPIDARQHVWWHRLRRLGPWGFTLLLGGLAAPLVTVLLFGGVILAYRYPWATFVRNGTLIWLVTSPIYLGSCVWTWFHMEGRYRDTLPVRCPRCGYSLLGGIGERCPECGETIERKSGESPSPAVIRAAGDGSSRDRR